MRHPLLLAILLGAITAHAAPRGTRPQHMANCPSAVPGASTRVANTENGVEITVTATDPLAVREIERRTDLQVHALYFPIPHVGLHGGPERIGYCPILHGGTMVTATATENGVVVHVDSTSRGNVKQLQAVTRLRASRLAGFVAS